jgi:glycosyltransferase involved in cell wall biosynthesis
MKKILFVSGSFPPHPDGVADFGRKILFELQKSADVDIYYLSADNIAVKGHFKVSNWGLGTLKGMINRIKNENYDLVFFQTPAYGFGTSLLSTFYPFLVKLFTRKKLFIYLHEYTSRRFQGRIRQAIMCAPANKLIVNDIRYIDQICKTVFVSKNKPFDFQPVGQNLDVKIIPRLNNTTEPYIIAYFGMIRSGKGIQHLIKLIEILEKSNSRKFELNLIGGIVDKALLDSFPSSVKYLGKVEEKDIPSVFSKMDVFVQLYDGGLTGKRGSFIAPYMFERPVITTKPQTKVWDFVNETTTNFVDFNVTDEVISEVANLIEKDASGEQKLRNFINNKKINIWDRIAQSVLE